MTALLMTYAALMIVAGSMILSHNQYYVTLIRNFQLMTQCTAKLQVLLIVAYFVLWSAACLLGVKFKMTSNEIHSAVMDMNVLSHGNIRSLLVGFGTLYAVSVIYLVLRVVLVFQPQRPAVELWVSSVLGFLLMACLIGLQYHSLSRLKAAVDNTDENQFRFKV